MGAGTRAGGSWSRDGVGRGALEMSAGAVRSHVQPCPTWQSPAHSPGLCHLRRGLRQEREPGYASGFQPSHCRFLRPESVGVNNFPLEQLLARLELERWRVSRALGHSAPLRKACFSPPVLESLRADHPHVCSWDSSPLRCPGCRSQKASGNLEAVVFRPPTTFRVP